MRPSFRNIVDQEPLPQVYIPELNDVTDICRVSVRKIMRSKGNNSGTVIGLREIINSVLWASAWLSLIAAGRRSKFSADNVANLDVDAAMTKLLKLLFSVLGDVTSACIKVLSVGMTSLPHV